MKINLNLPDNDNKKLANLCGVLDENLQQIAVGFNISILRKGSLFTLNGSKNELKLASQLIESFYHRASTPISQEDIQLLMVEVNKVNSDQLNTSPQLLTKKNDLQGRTPRQISYLNNIQKH
ncbi:PhoH family protein, partial [Methylophilaceae bacterium]|nr:PhoH family protein [Methylophilaceae bacterium]